MMSVDSRDKLANVWFDSMLILLLLKSLRKNGVNQNYAPNRHPKPTYSRVNAFRWLIRDIWIIEISFDSRYSSVVSDGMLFGISFSLFREQRTTVPVQVQDGGQYPSPRQPWSASEVHLNSKWGRSLTGTSRTLAGEAHRAGGPPSCFFRSQSENQPRWQLQRKGFEARFLRENGMLSIETLQQNLFNLTIESAKTGTRTIRA